VYTVINVIYYVLVAYIAIISIMNFIKTKDAQEAMLYGLLLIPFILRVFRIK